MSDHNTGQGDIKGIDLEMTSLEIFATDFAEMVNGVSDNPDIGLMVRCPKNVPDLYLFAIPTYLKLLHRPLYNRYMDHYAKHDDRGQELTEMLFIIHAAAITLTLSSSNMLAQQARLLPLMLNSDPALNHNTTMLVETDGHQEYGVVITGQKFVYDHKDKILGAGLNKII